MKTFLSVLATTTAIALASTAAFATDGPKSSTEYKAKDNGGYEVKAESKVTTPAGTDKKGMNKVDVDVSDEGKVSKDAKTENSSDPKGLMNAKSNTQKSMYKEKADGGYKAEAMQEHKDADGTNMSTKVETEVNVKDNGAVDKVVETTKTTDPKGLMNKKTMTTKTVNGKVVK